MNYYLGEWRLALVVLNTLLLLIPRKVQNMLCAKAAVRQRDYSAQCFAAIAKTSALDAETTRRRGHKQ